jgi:hypothetical protein
VREDWRFVVEKASHVQEHSRAERRNGCEPKNWEAVQGSIVAVKGVSLALAN